MRALRLLYLLVFLTTLHGAHAQSKGVQQQVEQFENNNDHEVVIKQINATLSAQQFSPEDKLALQIVVIHKFQELKQWDKCLAYCQQQIAEAHRQNDGYAEASFYKLLGNTYYHIPDPARALEYWRKCIAISETSGYNILLEQCYHNIGAIILESGSNLPEAERNFQKSIELSILNKTDTTQLGNLHYRLLATLYEVTGRVEKAGELYTKVIAKARLLNDSLRIAEALMFYAKVLVKEKKFDKAIQVGKEALLISGRIRKLDMEQTALDLLAESYVFAGNYKEAYQYMKQTNASFKNRFNTDLNQKISEAEAKFKTAETEHEKNLALLKAKKEKQVYLVAFTGLLLLLAVVFYSLYQRRSTRQKLAIQQQVQDEKERLSRDLHDNLGSQMALLSNNIETLDMQFRKQQPVADHMDALKGSSRQLLQTLRETIWILNQKQLSAADFFDKLVDYTHRYLQAYPGMQLRIEEEFRETFTLSSQQALQLFRICQEAVTNACKYAGGGELRIKGHADGNHCSVIIADSGSGFDPDNLPGNEQYGLRNMRQRAESIGASLTLASKPGAGTSVTVRL